MSRPVSHPFEQMPTDHPGWDRKHFDYRGREWSLLVINTLKADCAGELSSMLSDRGQGRTYTGYWKSHHRLSLPCRITVDAAIMIIDAMVNAFEEGRRDGAAAAQADVRKALGL